MLACKRVEEEGKRKLTVGSAPTTGIRLPADERRTGNIRQRRNLAIAQRHIQMLPLPRARPRQQRRHDAVAGVQPRRQIRDRHAHLHGRSVPRARDVHQTHFGLHHDVVARAVPIWPRLAVARDAGVDEARVEGADAGVVEGVFGEGGGEVVFDEDVAGLG